MEQGTEKIFVQGLKFSGSGAVLDWMKDQPELIVVPKRIWAFPDRDWPGNVGRILTTPGTGRRYRVALDECDKLRVAAMDDVGIRVAAKPRWKRRLHLLRNALRKPRNKSEPKRKRSAEHQSSSGKPDRDDLRIDLDFFQRFAHRLKQGETFDQAAYWREWLDTRLQPYRDGSRPLVLDKGLPIDTDRFDELWPSVYAPFRAVLVHRHPADQFAEILRQPRGTALLRKNGCHARSKSRSFARFLDWIETRLRSIHQMQSAQPERIMAVPFESFVHAHADWGQRIAEWAGFTIHATDDAHGAPHFQPEISARNIGIRNQAELLEPAILEQCADRIAELEKLRAALTARATDGPAT